MRAILAAIALLASVSAQEQQVASPQEEIRKIQTVLASDQGAGEDFATMSVQHDAQFGRLESLVSAYLIAQIEASPDIKANDLRTRLGELLRSPTPDDLPFVRRTDRFPGRAGASVFSVVYSGYAWSGCGWDGARVVVESYVLDHGKARLAGRLGRELDGVAGAVHQAVFDELLIEGLVTWSSGANLPYKAALYRVDESGVSLVWASGELRGMTAAVFGQYLLVNYVDEKAVPASGAKGFVWALDVYSLEDGIPNLVFQRDHLEGFALR
jgi:hypothetical protein